MPSRLDISHVRLGVDPPYGCIHKFTSVAQSNSSRKRFHLGWQLSSEVAGCSTQNKPDQRRAKSKSPPSSVPSRKNYKSLAHRGCVGKGRLSQQTPKQDNGKVGGSRGRPRALAKRGVSSHRNFDPFGTIVENHHCKDQKEYSSNLFVRRAYFIVPCVS